MVLNEPKFGLQLKESEIHRNNPIENGFGLLIFQPKRNLTGLNCSEINSIQIFLVFANYLFEVGVRS